MNRKTGKNVVFARFSVHLLLNKYLYNHCSCDSAIGVAGQGQHDQTFLSAVLEGRLRGDSGLKGRGAVAGGAVGRSAANIGVEMIQDGYRANYALEGAAGAGDGRSAANNSPALRLRDRAARWFHIDDYPDAAVGITLQARKAERNAITGRFRGIFQTDHRLRVARTA